MFSSSYRLKPNDETRIPSANLFVDTETVNALTRLPATEGPQAFRLGAAEFWTVRKGKWTHRSSLKFTDTAAFWQYAEECQHCRQPLTVWAHNIGFDSSILDLWERLDAREYSLSWEPGNGEHPAMRGSKKWTGVICAEARVAFYKLLGKVGKVNFYDLFNYYPMSLEEIGKRIGVPKSPPAHQDDDDEKVMAYCENDVHVLSSAVRSLLSNWEKHDCGCFQPTVSMCAYSNWRHVYLSKEGENGTFYLPKVQCKKQNNFERESFYGGRTEPFFYGRVQAQFGTAGRQTKVPNNPQWPAAVGPLHEYDFASFYCSIMVDGLFPCKRVEECTKWSPERLRAALGALGGIASVQLDTPDHPFPVRRNGATINAVGRFTTVLAGDELKLALDRNLVVSVGRGQLYRVDRIFKKFGELWWKRRLAADRKQDGAESLFCKSMPNALYGKFSQRGGKWEGIPAEGHAERYGVMVEWVAERKKYMKRRLISGYLQQREEADDPKHCFPAVSAFIAAAGRVKIGGLLETMPYRSVVYVSTDSLFVLDSGERHLHDAGLIHENALGKLRWKDTHEFAEIGGVNDLELPDKIIKAGVARKGRQEVDGGFVAITFENLPAVLARGPNGTVMVRKEVYKTHRHIWKNQVGADGWAVPWHLNWHPGDEPERFEFQDEN